MEVIQISGFPLARDGKPSVMALGNFDGVHIGHQQIIKTASDIARDKRLPLSVMTFHPHPRQVLGRGQIYESLLTPLSEKIYLFGGLGVETVYVIEFNREFAAISPGDFICEYVKGLHAKEVVVGFDYSFGAGGQADTTVLREICSRYGISSHVVPPVNRDGEKVSSSLIREKLQMGHVKWAADLLGRPFILMGHVVHGDKRGRILGFPTANIEPLDSFVIPKNGVYMIRAHLEGEAKRIPGVMNIGYKPTFEGERERTLEVHLLDFSRDIYGEKMRIEFLDFLRDERKFFSVEQLMMQIRYDVEEAKSRFSHTQTFFQE